MRRLVIPLAAAYTAAVVTMQPLPASASCAALPGQSPYDFTNATVVFVGTVTGTGDNDRRANVKVESIWRGPAIPTYVLVIGSPVSGPFQASSVDRHFQSGQRYIFVPTNSSPPFQDNSCTATQPYTAALAALAPSDAKPPLPGGDRGQPTVADFVPWLMLSAVALCIAGGVVLIWRRRASR